MIPSLILPGHCCQGHYYPSKSAHGSDTLKYSYYQGSKTDQPYTGTTVVCRNIPLHSIHTTRLDYSNCCGTTTYPLDVYKNSCLLLQEFAEKCSRPSLSEGTQLQIQQSVSIMELSLLSVQQTYPVPTVIVRRRCSMVSLLLAWLLYMHQSCSSYN